MMFFVGDQVTWQSQAAGSKTRKRGRVAAIIPARRAPINFGGVATSKGMQTFRHYGTRKEESYLVDVGGVLYWPRVSHLRGVARARATHAEARR